VIFMAKLWHIETGIFLSIGWLYRALLVDIKSSISALHLSSRDLLLNTQKCSNAIHLLGHVCKEAVVAWALCSFAAHLGAVSLWMHPCRPHKSQHTATACVISMLVHDAFEATICHIF
jgi:hypothetical protein